jgi:hypothetical protein
MRVTTVFDQLLFCVTRLEVDRPDKPNRPAVGTGFLVQHQWGKETKGDFLVTARHVVEAGPTGRMYLHTSSAGAPVLGNHYRLNVADWASAWQFHPDPNVDVAVLPFGPVLQHIKEAKAEVFTRTIQHDLVASDDAMSKLDSLESVAFHGFPMGLFDRAHMLPIARRGVTATPVFIDYEQLPAFLIDASVFWGSSGSPVFIADQGSYGTPTGTVIGSRLLLLGVLSKLFARVSSKDGGVGIVPVSDETDEERASPINLGLVFKTRAIMETIERLLVTRGEQPNRS